MSKTKHNIIWEKWVDPFGQNQEETKWSEYDNDNISSDIEDEEIRFQKINAIATHMGIIPYNEYTDCSKIFNFWLGHTNFDITQNVADIVQSIDGVETLDIFTRYRFRVAFGKAFSDREVMGKITETICGQNNKNI